MSETDQQRAAFEKWATESGHAGDVYDCRRTKDGEYYWSRIQDIWEAWQAGEREVRRETLEKCLRGIEHEVYAIYAIRTIRAMLAEEEGQK